MGGVVAELCHTVPGLGVAEAVNGEVLGCDGPDVCGLKGLGPYAFGLIPMDEVPGICGYACKAVVSYARDRKRCEESPRGSRGGGGAEVERGVR